MLRRPLNGVDPQEVALLCDAECDRRLFNTVKRRRPVLGSISDENVRTYDQAQDSPAQDDLASAVRPLHEDDRPDWIFCWHNKPVLVVEMTRHAYTGDNGLQRFARFAAAAEQGVPFIYFGPLKRVRDDEIDDEGRSASPRRLTSDLFEGMDKLSVVLDVPQLFVEWKTDAAGLPANLPHRCTGRDIENLYGELLDAIETAIFQAPLCITGRPLDDPGLRSQQARTRELASDTNTRFSDVKFQLEPQHVRTLLADPRVVVDLLKKSRYFSKGKPDKAVAQLALLNAEITAAQWPDGTLEGLDATAVRNLVDRVLRSRKFSRPAMLYYTGYKWRSDPHCGVLVNIDYRMCREPGQRTPSDRTRGLIVVYPRVSLNPDSAVWGLLSSISSVRPGPIRELFLERYGSEATKKLAVTLKSKNLYSLWKNSTKQARLFRKYADIVVLNDGLVLGDSLATEL